MRTIVKVLLTLALLSLWTVSGFGQAISGDLVGVVRDSSGAVAADASVDATNLLTGYKATTKANQSGEYRFTNLPVGHYALEATSGGLKGGYADIEVQLNHTSAANIVATIAGATTTVEVSEQATTIDTTTQQIATTYDAKQAQDLAIASSGGRGSGVLNLSLLSAGVATSGGIGAGTGPSVAGQRPYNNNFTVEGVDNNNKSVTGPLLQIPNDSVDNFTVLQNQFSPEFGHSSGGQFNQTIKSGTNQFHGRAWEYFQNRDLNAIDYQTALAQRSQGLTPYNTRLDDNRFGGQIGGPIIKDKLFFFTSWQYEPVGLTGNPSSACAPTAAGYSTLQSMFPNSNNLKVLQQYVPAATSQAAPNDTLCAQVSHVNGVSIPIGDVGFLGASYFNFLTNVNSGDWNISQKDQLRVRYGFSNTSQLDNTAQIPAFWTTIPIKYNLFTLGEYHNFTPNVNNEFRVGFNRYYAPLPTGPQTFPGLNTFPNLVIQELGGVQLGPNPNAPSGTIVNTYQATDNVSWVKGRHTFKFGGEYREYISPQFFTQRVRGDYEWGVTSGLDGYLNDLIPDPKDGGFTERSVGNVTYYGNQQAMYLYGNDEWKLRPNLTLNLGLRYELTTVPLSQTQLQPLNAISNAPGVLTFGVPQKQTTNVLPRVGFAYSPGESGTWSIRGGFGMAVDVLYDNLGILSLPPQVQQTCDGGPPGAGNPQTATCYWSNTSFLANGGLPSSQPQPFTDVLTARQATSAWIPNQSLPYAETWNLGVQHIFAQKYTLEVRYVGTKGIHLPVQDRINRQPQSGLSEYLPTYLVAPSQAQLNALPLTLAQINNNSSFVPRFDAAGFNGSNITAYMPYGASNYNSLQTQFTRNFTNGLQFQAAWTWSHAFDNSTADVFSTVLTPRRPQDFQNFAGDWSASALDRRHRVTLEAIYDLPFFKNASWFMKNIVGNWQFAPIYFFETPEYATVQSHVDANGNGDAWTDRAIINPAGIPGTGSAVTPLTNSAGQVVAYLANNPRAQYVAVGVGALATAPRNTLPLPRINDWDMTLLKRINITERQAIEFQAQAINIFNHPQFVPGYISDVQPANTNITTAGTTLNMLIPGNQSFNQPQNAFSSHPRAMTLVFKYIF
jgi:hypothetical protein